MMRFVRRVPLRVKLVTSVLVLVGAALLVISIGSAFALRSYLIDKVDSELNALTEAAEASLMSGQKVLVGITTDVVVVTATPQGVEWPTVDPRLIKANQLPRLPESYAGFQDRVGEPYTVKASDQRVRWRVQISQLPSGQVMAVAQSLVDVDEAVTRLIWVDALVGGAVLILLATIGAAIVRSSLGPLNEIERTAAAIAGGDLTRRVPDPEPGEEEPQTELGRLSRALNAMLAQIEAAFTARADSESAARAAESAARDAAFAAQASEARARRSEERMRQFVADASHELRTPLTTIRGFAELYRQGAASSPEEVARLVRRIEDEASRMGLLVEDLLLLARLDRERPVELAPVELPVLAADAVQAARAMAPDREIHLEVASGAGPLVVLGDDARLRQVIGNLMTNALTHTPSDASVTLRLLADKRGDGEAEAVIEVADTGPGLSHEQAERVFERFYRADAARTRRADGAPGSGLGLAIVAALVAAHSGTVEVDSTPGKGATFRVRLPLALDDSEALAHDDELLDPEEGSRLDGP
ncbi:HAMP domain-containing sensor histidine kinase [Phytohabitans flavus]|uniref:histidine kinase n=1 Tax=Phytohabitans flavus TaxID=1076124 RepID=A0A6F8Y6T3_9ACTN|nr:HAMP domain-containing sensor histidine kinase [Phytohabitans flavus]BCB81739.1 two-component sensor histidine kinase [Phytohabitans flavus]